MSNFESMNENDLINLNGGGESDYEFGYLLGNLYSISLIFHPAVYPLVSTYITCKAIYDALT